jgi:hypothetical protein
MTKYQEWKLYGRYILRRIRKRVQRLLSRLFPGSRTRGRTANLPRPGRYITAK